RRDEANKAAITSREALALLDKLGAQERDEAQISLVASDALRAAGDSAAAAAALARAEAAFRARDARISDEAIRQSYRAVAHNAELLARVERA
ncbi:MAG: hypothetical protein KC503_28785, partial [Myxococcales bacterium]|nr:hypothetical protein [Myxococcales bacterium]